MQFVRYGGTLIADGTLTLESMLMVFMAVLFTAMGMGQASAMMPDASKARAAAVSVFQLLDRESACDPFQPSGRPPIGVGKIEFRDVEFAYPSRLQQTVLRGLNMRADEGKVLALCGSSGCGKMRMVLIVGVLIQSKSAQAKAQRLDCCCDITNRSKAKC